MSMISSRSGFFEAARVRAPLRMDIGQTVDEHEGIVWQLRDPTNRHLWQRLSHELKGFDSVLHRAAVPPPTVCGPRFLLETNLGQKAGRLEPYKAITSGWAKSPDEAFNNLYCSLILYTLLGRLFSVASQSIYDHHAARVTLRGGLMFEYRQLTPGKGTQI
jgi:hypothetical protein